MLAKQICETGEGKPGPVQLEDGDRNELLINPLFSLSTAIGTRGVYWQESGYTTYIMIQGQQYDILQNSVHKDILSFFFHPLFVRLTITLCR